ncbi:MAG: aldo/keto reductase [Clostridia bacterium]|nr:aldo/keto reductase [Clostridia bacterium]
MNMFSEIKKNFGFGCMRLPMNGEEVDLAQVSDMVDAFLEAGFNYFDTAHGYIGTKSEPAVRECLVKRYPRDRYVLTDKLSGHLYEKEEDIRPLFQKQLDACGVDYFDFYLMHSQTAESYAKCQRCRAYEIAQELKSEGKIRHVGISFHDTADVLEKILIEHPEIEVVQLQFNYVDYEDVSVQGRKCYEMCVKYEKPVIVMEPVKGGCLVNLPAEAQQVLDELNGGWSNAAYAIRYAASFDNNIMVLSGMSSMEQMQDNLNAMKDFTPLTQEEHAAIQKVCDIFRRQDLIACTACRYCVDGCPANIDIPSLFACMNAKKLFRNWNTDFYYHDVYTVQNGKASACVECGACESICPQHLPIRSLLKEVAKEFEK